MSTTIINQLDPLFETAGLLYISKHLDKNKQETIKELNNLGMNGELFFQNNMMVFEKYVQVFKRNSVTEPATDSFFFEDEDPDLLVMFMAVLLENRDWLSSMDKISDEIINKQLIQYLSEEFSVSPYQGEYGLEDIFDFLGNCDLPESTKWKAMSFIRQPIKWMSELIKAINSNSEAYKKAVESVEKPLNKFLKKYSENKDEQFEKMVSSVSNISTIQPTLVFPISQLLFNSYGYYGLLSAAVFKNQKISGDLDDKFLIRLKALSDRSKLEILKSLKISPKYNLEIAESLGLTAATMSYHMGVLLTCGFVGIEKKDGKVYYHLEHENINKLIRDLDKLLL